MGEFSRQLFNNPIVVCDDVMKHKTYGVQYSIPLYYKLLLE